MNNILMNSDMTKAILEGVKKQTRRIIPFNNNFALVDNQTRLYYDGEIISIDTLPSFSKYKKDEIIWVREPAKIVWYQFSNEDWKDNLIEYQYSDSNKSYEMVIPDRFLMSCPKWITGGGIPNGCIKEMARIFLKITEIKVQRLQDISIEDIFDEGFPVSLLTENYGDAECIEKSIQWYKTIWDKTAKNGFKWEDNPFVFVYKFKRVQK